MQGEPARAVAQAADAKARVEIHTRPMQQASCVPGHGTVVERSPGGQPLLAEEEVGSDVQARHEVELLRDHDDAGLVRLARGGETGRRTGQRDRAAIRRRGAGDDGHQRALAGTVLAQQDMDLAGAQVEIDAAQGMHAAEPLLDAGEPQQRLVHLGRRPMLKRSGDVTAIGVKRGERR